MAKAHFLSRLPMKTTVCVHMVARIKTFVFTVEGTARGGCLDTVEMGCGTCSRQQGSQNGNASSMFPFKWKKHKTFRVRAIFLFRFCAMDTQATKSPCL